MKCNKRNASSWDVTSSITVVGRRNTESSTWDWRVSNTANGFKAACSLENYCIGLWNYQHLTRNNN